MSLDILCTSSGINGGTTDCPIAPGVGKYFVVWGGKLTPQQLAAGYATCKAALVADSKKSKNNSAKLVVFPLVRKFTPKKEANVEASLADGFKQVTREGLPAYELEVVTDMYLIAQLRKLNNKRIKYAIVDDKNLFLATTDIDGNFVGRSGKIFADGLDAHDYDKVDGQTIITVNGESAYETYDNAKCIELDKKPEGIFSALKDVQLYEKAAATETTVIAATAATRTVTITDEGDDNDTIDIVDDQGNSICGGPITKTSSETTPTLLATKIKTAINANTGTNGGYSAANTTAVMTITAPASLGATVNTLDTAPVIVGTITASTTAFTGGVTRTFYVTMHISAKMDSPNANKVIDFYEDYAASALGTDKSLWTCTNSQTGAAVAFASVTPNALGYFDVVPNTAAQAALVSGNTLELGFVDPTTLDASLVKGIEGVSFLYTKP